MSLNYSQSSFVPIPPLHYSHPSSYHYRRPILPSKTDESRPSNAPTTIANSGNSSPAPSLSSGTSSEVSSPPPQSPHTFTERPSTLTTDYYSMIPKTFNPTTVSSNSSTSSVSSYPASNYPPLDFPAFGYDFYSNTTNTPQKLPLTTMPSLPMQTINDPSVAYSTRDFNPYDPMMNASYDPAAMAAYSRNRLFYPNPHVRNYPTIEDEWGYGGAAASSAGEVKGKKRGGEKKRRYDTEEDAARKRARSNQRAAAAVNPNHKQRSIIHCGIPRAYLEKKQNGESVDVNDDDRVYFLFSPFFGKELDVYYADDDPFHRPLFRASALHKKFGCATNKMDMYLCRKKAKEGPKCGIFQCLCFDGRREEHGLFGLKAGTYFVSEDACAAFAEHAKEQRFRKKRTARAKREKEMAKGRVDGSVPPEISSEEEEEANANAQPSSDRGVEMMVHMIQMLQKSGDNKGNENNPPITNLAPALLPNAASNPTA